MPLGRELSLRLPAAPDYPGMLSGVQTVAGQYGERKAAFQAALELTPVSVNIALTAINGPRILSINWTKDGIVEDRTPLAPADLRGVNVLGDIFVSMWPADRVRAALPSGVELVEDGQRRTLKAKDRTIVEVETLERSAAGMKQTLRNLDFGYVLNIATEIDP